MLVYCLPILKNKLVAIGVIRNRHRSTDCMSYPKCRGHGNVLLKVWSTVKIHGTRGPQKAIVPVGRPRPYSIILLNMRFIPKASLRASTQITASSYILERHL